MEFLESNDKYKVVRTCDACPEQYDIYDKDGHQVAYVRERWEHLTVECPDCGDILVFSADLTDEKQCVKDFEKEIFTAIDESLKYVGHCGFDNELTKNCEFHCGVEGCKCLDVDWSFRCPLEVQNTKDLDRILEIEELEDEIVDELSQEFESENNGLDDILKDELAEQDALQNLDEMMNNNYPETKGGK